jgi:hypothetical protein
MSLVPRPVRRALTYLHAVLSTTLAGNGRWEDWYRIPIPDGKDLRWVTIACRRAGIHDGPYWGTGRECRATGQTKKAGSHSEDKHH